MFDLTRAMTDAADLATAHRDPLAHEPLLPRIHRRRAALLGGRTVLGAVAVGVLAVVATQLTPLAVIPQPPAGSIAPSGWPAAVSVPAVPACGETLQDLDLREDALQSAVTANLSTRMPSGAAVAITSTLTFAGLDERETLYVTEQATPVVVLVDGTGRVAALGGGLARTGPVGGSSGSSVGEPTLVPLVACDGSGPLTPGQYGTYAFWQLSAGQDAPAPSSGWTMLTGGDGVLVVAGSGTAVDVTESVGDFAAPVPGCGETTGGLATAPALDSVTASATIDVGTIDDAGELVHATHPDVIRVTSTVTNDGAPLGLGIREERLAWVLADADGRVIATGRSSVELTDTHEWAAGEDRPYTLVDDIVPCGTYGPIGPGSYQVWVVADVPADLSPTVAGMEPLGVVVGPITLVLAS